MPAEQPSRAAIAGLIVAALITLPGLGVGTLWDNSETAYGEVAREILLTHDWVIMHFNGTPWYVQPPLYFWFGALTSLIFGVSSFALRLPAALATIAMGGMTGYAVARQVGTRAGVFCSIVLSSCFMQAIVGRLAIMDALLDLAVALSVFWWFRALQTGQARYAVYGWIAAALGFLVKGPVAPVISLMVIVAYGLWNNREERTYIPPPRSWVVGGLAFVAIVAPWFFAVAARTGWHGVAELIGHYTFGRYTGVIENQTGPIWYYIPVVILGLFPWIAFLPMGLAWCRDALRQRSTSDIARVIRLALVWTIVPFVFFSFAKTKLPNYIALEFPGLALIVGLYLDNAVHQQRRVALIVSACTVPVFVGMLAIAGALFVRDNRLTADAMALIPELTTMAVALIVGAIVMIAMLWSDVTSQVAPYALGAATIVTIDTMVLFALPYVEAFKPIPPLASVIQAQRKPGDVVAIQTMAGGNSLIFYTQPGVQVLDAPNDTGLPPSLPPQRVICNNDRVFVVAPKRRPAFDPTYGRNRKIIAADGKAAAFLYDGPKCN